MQKQKRDRVERDGVVLTGAMFRCTGKCGLLKPGSEFGLRSVDGTVRNQSQCATCRASRVARNARRAA